MLMFVHGSVVRGLIERIPPVKRGGLDGEIIGPDGHAAYIEFAAAYGVEQFLHHAFDKLVSTALSALAPISLKQPPKALMV